MLREKSLLTRLRRILLRRHSMTLKLPRNCYSIRLACHSPFLGTETLRSSITLTKWSSLGGSRNCHFNPKSNHTSSQCQIDRCHSSVEFICLLATGAQLHSSCRSIPFNILAERFMFPRRIEFKCQRFSGSSFHWLRLFRWNPVVVIENSLFSFVSLVSARTGARGLSSATQRSFFTPKKTARWAWRSEKVHDE